MKDWSSLCVVKELPASQLGGQTIPQDIAWSDETIKLTQHDVDLHATIQGKEYVVFDGHTTPTKETPHPDVYVGALQVHERWVTFETADSSDWNVPWRLRVWDRTKPDVPAKVIGQYDGTSENPGFPLAHLRGDHLVWTEAPATNRHQVKFADLAAGTVHTVFDGSAYKVRNLDEHTLIWQSQKVGSAVTLVSYDLRTGKMSTPDNPLATKDAVTGSYATDGEFWVLTNVPSGDPDNPSTTWDTWAWHPSWAEPKRIVALEGPAYVSNIEPLTNGLLGLSLQREGAHLIDLRQGIAQRLRDDWAVVDVDQNTAHLDWGIDGGRIGVQADLPLHSLTQPGACQGQPLRG